MLIHWPETNMQIRKVRNPSLLFQVCDQVLKPVDQHDSQGAIICRMRSNGSPYCFFQERFLLFLTTAADACMKHWQVKFSFKITTPRLQLLYVKRATANKQKKNYSNSEPKHKWSRVFFRLVTRGVKPQHCNREVTEAGGKSGCKPQT